MGAKNGILRRFVTNKFIEHPDGTCGACLREMIKCEVAKEYIDSDVVNVTGFFKEVDRRWRETPIYKEVKALLDSGKTLDEVVEIMAEKGIEI